jgi:hypothetical protein
VACNPKITVKTVAHTHVSGDIINFYSDVAQVIHDYSINWDSTYTTVNSNSATWGTGGGGPTDTRFVRLSGDIMSGALSAPTISAGTLYVGASTIFFLNSANQVVNSLNSQNVLDSKSNYTTVNSNSANWNTGYNQSNILAGLSANNTSNYTTVNSNSANWSVVYTGFIAQSGNNGSVYTTVNSNSAAWTSYNFPAISATKLSITGIVGAGYINLPVQFPGTPNNPDTSTINIFSKNTNSFSIQIPTGGIGTFNLSNLTSSRQYFLPDVSGNIITTGDTGTVTDAMLVNGTKFSSNYTTVSSNSANWGSVYSNVNANSANNASNYSNNNSLSAKWIAVYASVSSLSANWQSNYTTVNTNSATWGGGGTGSGLTLFKEVSSLSGINNPVFALTATSISANIDAVFAAKGTGATIAQIPDGSTRYGIARGPYATDWQKLRTVSNAVAAGSGAFIGGGTTNRAAGDWSVVVGGQSNNVLPTATTSTIVGGVGNNILAGAVYGFIGGGSANIINPTALYSVIVGGNSNVTNGNVSVIGGGTGNSIQTGTQYGFIGSGSSNVITNSAQYATIVGGSQNYIAADLASVTGGYGAYAYLPNSQVKSHGSFYYIGDAQQVHFTMSGTCQRGHTTVLSLNGADGGPKVILVTDRVLSCIIQLIGVQDDMAVSSYTRQFIMSNVSGTHSLQQSVTLGTDLTNAGAATFSADDTYGLNITVGSNGSQKTVWLATIYGVELTRARPADAPTTTTIAPTTTHGPTTTPMPTYSCAIAGLSDTDTGGCNPQMVMIPPGYVNAGNTINCWNCPTPTTTPPP